MKPRTASATLLLFALAVLAAGSGCGHDHVTQPPPPQEVHGSDQGWPPPPPVAVGLDTAHVGGTVSLRWWVWNDDSIPFSMKWTLASDDGWPGLPQTGTVDLSPWEQYILTTTASVPDTARIG